MDYHVLRDGKSLGVFPLQELFARKLTGEFLGSDLVWRAGMENWQTLDSVLQSTNVSSAPPALPGAIRPQQAQPRRSIAWIVALVIAVFVIGSAALVFVSVTTFKRLRLARQQGASSQKGVESASAPILVSPKTSTQKEVNARAKAFRIRQYIDGYRDRGHRDPGFDTDALKFLNAWIAQNYGDQESTNSPSVDELGNKLAANSACDDPLLLTAAGVTSIERHAKLERLDRALKLYPASKHRAYPHFFAIVSLTSEEPSKFDGLNQAALATLKNAFDDGSITPEDQPEMAEIFLDGWGHEFFRKNSANILKIVSAKGSSFDWLRLVIEGEHHITEAWRARGGGYANTVTDQGWQSFTTHSAAARDALKQAWRLRPDLPQAPARMIYVAMGDSSAEEMRGWFDCAITAQIDYNPAWWNMRWGLRPRWHGSTEALLALGTNAIGTGRFDTDVPRKFLDIVEDVESELSLRRGQHIYARPDIWPHLVQMYEGYIAHPAQTNQQAWWRTVYAVVGFLSQHYPEARDQLSALDWKPVPYALTGWSWDLSLMPLEVAAMTSPASRPLSQAETSRRRGAFDDAIRRYQQLSGTNLDERTLEFIRHRLAIVEIERRLQSGEWTPFMPASNDDLVWSKSVGTFRSVGTNSLEVDSDPRGHFAYSRCRVGSDFEIRGEFDVIKSSTSDFQAGIVMGMPLVDENDWWAFRIKRNRFENDLVSYSHGWTTKQAVKQTPVRPDHNSFRFRLQRGTASAWLNDQQIFNNEKQPGQIYLSGDGFFVGLGAYNDVNHTTIRYRNVELRKLQANDPAPNSASN
jgi:GYF domain 2